MSNDQHDILLPRVDGPSYMNFKRSLAERDFSVDDIAQLTRDLENAFAKNARIGSRYDMPRTNLVVGDVQSGKTTAIEGTIALANDNSVKLVILLTGRSTALSEQSQNRIFDGLDSIGGIQAFRTYTPSDLDRFLDDLRYVDSPALSGITLVYSMLKDFHYLEPLVLGINRLNLSSKQFQSIVIDDEADQASPDTNAQNQQQGPSTTHAFLTQLVGVPNVVSGALPQWTTYLQITATPTGLFLIPPPNLCTPCYTSLLTPGRDYVGIRVFFVKLRDLLLSRIPDNETPDNWPEQHIPPSLNEAIDWYLVSYSIIRTAKRRDGTDYFSGTKPLSMLCHPERTVVAHADYRAWIESTLQQYRRDLSDPLGGQPLLSRLEETYNTVKSQLISTPNEFVDSDCQIQDWDSDELRASLEEAITLTQVKLINTQNQVTDIRQFWRVRSVIVCGGDGVGRGFTFEGLITTYLARPVGNTPNADTVQQRARFCGYRRKILPFMKVFLSEANRILFSNYVLTENIYRTQISRFEMVPYGHINGDELRLHLSGSRPSRQNIYATPNTQDLRRFFDQRQPHLISEAQRLQNLTLLCEFIRQNSTSFSCPDSSSPPFFDRLSASISIDRISALLERYAGAYEDNMVLDFYRALIRGDQLPRSSIVKVVIMQNRTLNQRVVQAQLSSLQPDATSLLSSNLGRMSRGHRRLFLDQDPVDWSSISLRDMKLT